MYYSIDASVPLEWHAVIHAAAQTWTAVSGSDFSLVYSPGSSNIVKIGGTQNLNAIAEAYLFPYYPFESPIQWAWITINHLKVKEIVPTDPPQDKYSLQSNMLHEFGHWIALQDIRSPGCNKVVMWYDLPKGEEKTALTGPDSEGLLWKYP